MLCISNFGVGYLKLDLMEEDKQKKKRTARRGQQKKWTEEETRSILEYLLDAKIQCKRPDSFTTKDFVKEMIHKLSIQNTEYSKVCCRIRDLKRKYHEVLMYLNGAEITDEKERETEIKSRCKYFYILDEIYRDTIHESRSYVQGSSIINHLDPRNSCIQHYQLNEVYRDATDVNRPIKQESTINNLQEGNTSIQHYQLNEINGDKRSVNSPFVQGATINNLEERDTCIQHYQLNEINDMDDDICEVQSNTGTDVYLETTNEDSSTSPVVWEERKKGRGPTTKESTDLNEEAVRSSEYYKSKLELEKRKLAHEFCLEREKLKNEKILKEMKFKIEMLKIESAERIEKYRIDQQMKLELDLAKLRHESRT